MDFFEDLQVPPSVLFDPTEYREEGGEGMFVWKSSGGDEDPEAEVSEYFFDKNEKCLCRVEMEQWHDLSPQMQQQTSQKFANGDANGGEGEDGEEEPRKQPYSVQASMMHSGLGPKLWWLGEDDLEQEAQDAVFGEGDGDDVEMVDGAE